MNVLRTTFVLLAPALLLPAAAQANAPSQPMAVAKRLDGSPPAAASSAPKTLPGRSMMQATTASSPPTGAPAAAPRLSGLPLAVAKRR